MFLTDEKLEHRIRELQEYRYRDRIHLERFAVREDTENSVNPALPESFDGWETLCTGDIWTGRDRYLWMHREISVPLEWQGRRILGIFDFGRTGGGNNSGFEAMVYLNGTMYQAVDGNHKEVFFDPSLCGTTLDVTWRLWSGLEGGGVPTPQEHRIKCADLAWLDEETDDFYYLASMVSETVKLLEDSDPVKYDLRNALDAACRRIDWSYPGSDAFYESVHEADAFLNQVIDGMDKKSAVNVWCVGHTHIDMAWLWRLKHTKEKGSRSFSTVLRLMEQYPEYIFLQTQPQIYEYMKEEFPDIYQQIKKRVAEGRWEADGAMWVEADCNLTSGESLTRQILLGSRFIKEEFGRDVEFLWLPDVFGYSWALPQVLKKAGIRTFMTTKISWNQYNRMPHDTFMWRGIDGSEVLTHFITTPDPGKKAGSWFYTYNGQLCPEIVRGVWDAYSEKQTNRDMLISYGFGDGGGGVNRDMLEKRRRMDRIPGLPNVKTTTAGDYFRKLHDTMEHTDQRIPVWDGELYLEYHRGTYTSHGYNKRMNRKMELLYRQAEWMTVMSGLQQDSLDYAQQEELTRGWKHILTDQFHDIIPGSSIHEVYEDSQKDYAYIESVAEDVKKDAMAHITQEKEDCWTVWNASAWERDEIVEVPNSRIGIYRDGEGHILTAQAAENVTYVEIKHVPAMGASVILFEEAERKDMEGCFRICGKEIETPYYRISFNDVGQITRLYDKTFDREVLAEGERGNVLQIFEDKPLQYDAWDIDIFYQEKMREITDLTRFEVTECGPLQMKLAMEWKYMNSTVRQDLILYSTDRRIDFRTVADYHEQHQLLKAAFPVNIRATYATYDVQYGNVRRPNHWNTSWDQARFESVAHRWADLSERNYGVSLLNDCKYGHDIKDNVMRISLLKAATSPDYLQDQGIHEFTYSLLPHGGDFVDGRVVQEAYALNDPMQVVGGVSVLPYESFVTFDNEQVELDAVKKSEDGKYIVIRFHEFAGSAQKVTMRPGFAFRSWTECDLRERPVGEACTEQEIRLSLHAYEIKTVLVEV